MARRSLVKLMIIGVLFVVLMFGVFHWLKTPRSTVFISDHMNKFIDAVDSNSTLDKQKLVVIDLDDTLLIVKNQVGSPTWFYHSANTLRRFGASKNEAYQVLRDIELKIQDDIKFSLVEPVLKKAIKYWQSRGVTVLGFTTRSDIFLNFIHKKLAGLGISFVNKKFSCIESSWVQGQGVFEKGVLFANRSGQKAQAFKDFFRLAQLCNHTIKLVAYVDDQERYISAVAKIAVEQQKNFIGMIYGGGLARQNYDKEKAQRELVKLDHANKFSIIPQRFRHVFEAQSGR